VVAFNAANISSSTLAILPFIVDLTNPKDLRNNFYFGVKSSLE